MSMHPKRDLPKKISKDEMKKAFKNILGTSKNFYISILIAALFILGGVIISIIAPQFLSDLTNEIANNAQTKNINMEIVSKNGIILACLYFASALLTYGSSFILTGVTQKYANSLRRSISIKINKIPLSYFDSHQVGDILSRVTNDVDSVAQSLDQSISMLLQAVFMLIGSLIGMFVTSY